MPFACASGLLHCILVDLSLKMGVVACHLNADLLQAGADDYIGKRDLTSGVPARISREALARADAWRKRDVHSDLLLRPSEPPARTDKI